ncbi:MAG: methionyl-tRNA formyltransferase [Bacteroidales bacterium]|nr:methionyl-tRNA formyltransferase [Bacteroidales bacterium]
MKPRQLFRVVFMGTPPFAVRTLEELHEAGYSVVGVVTAADKPAGRGLQPRFSAVKQFAQKHNMALFQPTSLKEDSFIESLKALQADLFVVVAFRMLPEMVWRLPEHGTINLHASLLPQYRGAAPINWAIINGEIKTGITTFLIDREIDTGKILMQEETHIALSETAGELHDRLMEKGAALVLKTVDAIREGSIKLLDQKVLIPDYPALKKAPKILKADCHINWSQDADAVFNRIRGLSPHPAAFTFLKSPDGTTFQMKIFSARPAKEFSPCEPGDIFVNSQNQVFVAVKDSSIELLEVQLAGRARMNTKNFLNGFKIDSGWKVE